LLIDFAKVDSAPASLDPLTLELSLLFHPAYKGLCAGWPSLKQAQHWNDLNVFTADCPVDKYVHSCRKCAFEIDAGDKAVYATAYAYAVRQLKYSNTDHKLAVAIAECCGRLVLK